jgi:hypothetical protein
VKAILLKVHEPIFPALAPLKVTVLEPAVKVPLLLQSPPTLYEPSPLKVPALVTPPLRVRVPLLVKVPLVLLSEPPLTTRPDFIVIAIPLLFMTWAEAPPKTHPQRRNVRIVLYGHKAFIKTKAM